MWDSWVPILACHSPGGCVHGTRRVGTGPSLPLSLLSGVSIHLCSLAGPWESAGIGFCKMETRGCPPTGF